MDAEAVQEWRLLGAGLAKELDGGSDWSLAPHTCVLHGRGQGIRVVCLLQWYQAACLMIYMPGDGYCAAVRDRCVVPYVS